MATNGTQVFQVGLRRSQHKLTRPRQAVLDVIAAAQEHLTPAEVFRRARERYPKIGLTTVYRTLDLLVELGCVQRVHGENGCHSYVAAMQPHGHHLLCSHCGRMEAFADCDLRPLVEALEVRTGYRIEAHILQLVGCCPSCQGRVGVDGIGVAAPRERQGHARGEQP